MIIKKSKKFVNKFVFEVQYVPNPTFIDIRGEIASIMLSKNLTEWNISQDRTEVSGKGIGIVFASYNSLGFVTENKEYLSTCMEAIERVLRRLGDVPPIRWGVRTSSLIESNTSFPKLVNFYKNSLFKYEPQDFNFIEGQLVDIGASYIFAKNKDKYHLSSGPMQQLQAKSIFLNSNLPQKGLFIDLDIYREKENFYKDDFRKDRIKSFMHEKFLEAEEIITKFQDTLNDK